MLRIKTALRYGQRFLSCLENPSLETEVLLADILQCDRIYIKTHPHQKLLFLQSLKFFIYIFKRRQHIPLAYITKHKTWSDFEIDVNKHVLIPRDETEILCHHILSALPHSPFSILDLGTGSGCISLFMAKHFPKAQITALDISPQALQIAQKNAKKYKLQNINFLHSDLLASCPARSVYDLIIANLPYVPKNLEISPEVQQEPDLALFSGTDGLAHIQRLKTQLEAKQINFSQLWLEFLPQQQAEIKNIFSDYKIQFFPEASNKIFFAAIYSSSRTPRQK